ncbi:winged helix DNA-binding domain-containing protein [Leifsonia poae]|uniref:winged helix DNA-binding domain-containing protein n=1 Tax=Leifsonia poae TaxID=110933 RepID=UPI001CBB23E4|nr:winged helix DNA-binding domain-containing protein [Leifsonia poae]
MTASAADLLRFRLLAHGLEGPTESSPSAVVERMLAVQAQDFGAACWALGIRAPGTTQQDVLAELDAGRIVRSWPMRGTLHFVPPADLGWMLSLTTERMLAGLTLRHRQLELESPDFIRARDVATGAIAGGGSISRAELLSLWEENGIATTGQRGYHLIYYLAQIGVLVWGPAHKTQQSLVLAEEWIAHPRRLDHDEALAEFLVRYLTGHGPATLKDFVWWTKGTVVGTKTALAVAGDRLRSLTVDGVEYWLTSELADRALAPTTAAERAAVVLLPGFDEYIIGYQIRGPVLDPAHADLVVPGGNGVFAPVVLARGRAVGTWKRTTTAKRVTLAPQPFSRPLTAGQLTRLDRGARAYGRFLGLTGTVA